MWETVFRKFNIKYRNATNPTRIIEKKLHGANVKEMTVRDATPLLDS